MQAGSCGNETVLGKSWIGAVMHVKDGNMFCYHYSTHRQVWLERMLSEIQFACSAGGW